MSLAINKALCYIYHQKFRIGNQEAWMLARIIVFLVPLFGISVILGNTLYALVFNNGMWVAKPGSQGFIGLYTMFAVIALIASIHWIYKKTAGFIVLTKR